MTTAMSTATQHGYALFVLDEGRARAELNGQVLEQLEPGAVFGEVAFFAPNSWRSATVVAETHIRVFSMFGTHFRERCRQRCRRWLLACNGSSKERTARTGGTQEG